MAQRQVYSSNFFAILTIAGASIGLGNVWRFPYMMGAYGGSAFLLVYLAFTILIAIPALVGEWSLGREAGGGTIRSFTHTLGPRRGRLVGYLLIFGILMANPYYIVIIGNVGYTTYFSIVHGFSAEAFPHFAAGLTDGTTQFSIATAVVLGIILVALNR
jgi:NSS family neurotransmitter:Na+ symporter